MCRRFGVIGFLAILIVIRGSWFVVRDSRSVIAIKIVNFA